MKKSTAFGRVVYVFGLLLLSLFCFTAFGSIFSTTANESGEEDTQIEFVKSDYQKLQETGEKIRGLATTFAEKYEKENSRLYNGKGLVYINDECGRLVLDQYIRLEIPEIKSGEYKYNVRWRNGSIFEITVTGNNDRWNWNADTDAEFSAVDFGGNL